MQTPFVERTLPRFAELTSLLLYVLPKGEGKFTARLTHTAAGRERLSLKEVTSIKLDVWQYVM